MAGRQVEQPDLPPPAEHRTSRAERALLAGTLLLSSAVVAGEASPALASGDGLVAAESTTRVRLYEGSAVASPQEQSAGLEGGPRVIVTNITGTESAGPGFVQAHVSDSDRGGWSNLNFDGQDQTRANLALITTDSDGYANFFSKEALGLIIDTQGDITAGVDDIADVRLVDSRGSNGDLAPPGAGSFTAFDCEPGKPLVGNLTAVGATGDGFLQLVDSVTSPDVGRSSHINYVGGQTIARLAVGACGVDGRGYIYSPFGNVHVLWDPQVRFKSGVFTPNPSPRSLDTREQGGAVAGGQTVSLHGLAGRTAIVGLVGTGNTEPGFLQVLGEGVEPGTTSNVNLDRTATTTGSLVIAQFNASGELPIYVSHGQSDVVADIYGYLADGAFIDTPDERVHDSRIVPRPPLGLYNFEIGFEGEWIEKALKPEDFTISCVVTQLAPGEVPGYAYRQRYTIRVRDQATTGWVPNETAVHFFRDLGQLDDQAIYTGEPNLTLTSDWYHPATDTTGQYTTYEDYLLEKVLKPRNAGALKVMEMEKSQSGSFLDWNTVGSTKFWFSGLCERQF